MTNQKLSKPFIIEFKDKLNLEEMLEEKIITRKFYKELTTPVVEKLNRFDLMILDD